jgi:hypothetical protein
MNDELIIRKQAIELYLKGTSVIEIGRKLGKSRQWVHKWINRYRTIGGDDWYKSLSKAPKKVYCKTAVKKEELVINIRKSLEGRLYSQTGALSIMYEFERLGLKSPSISTINRILKRNDLIKMSNVKRCKTTEYPNYFTLVQQMDLVGPKYLKGGFRFYILDIIDTENHFAGVYPIKDKRAVSITEVITRFWSTYGMPDFLQMDNELSFRGSNRHPRGLGLLLRLALLQGVTPIFIPPSEPWRNGIIEKFNFTMEKYFFSAHKFVSFEDIEKKSMEFSDFHNHNHRYTSQGGKTPCMLKSISQEHLLKKIMNPIPLADGTVVFIRFIRSDRKLHVLGTSFTLKPELTYTYVVAELVIERHVLVVKQNGMIYHIFPFVMPVS